MSKEDSNLGFAQKLYDESLSQVVALMNRKGLFRVVLHDTGYVLSIKGAKATSRPQLGSFLIRFRGNSTAPSFGNLNRLNKWQEKIAVALQNDIQRIITTCSVAEVAIGSPTKDVHTAKKTMADLEKRFGKMPEIGILDALHERERKEEEEKKKIELRKQLLDDIPENCFEDYVASIRLEMEEHNKRQSVTGSAPA